MLNIYSAIIWVVAIIELSFGVILYFMNNKRSSRSLVFISTVIALWSASLGGFFAASTPEAALAFARLSHVLGSLIAVSIYVFTLLVHDENRPLNPRIVYTLISIEAVFAYMYLATNFFTSGVLFTGPDPLDRLVVDNSGIAAHYLYFIVLGILGARELTHKPEETGSEHGHSRNILYVFAATIGTIALTLLVSRILGFHKLYWLVPVGSLIWVPAAAYSLVKFGVVPLRLFVAQLTVLAMSVIAFIDIFITDQVFGSAGKITVFLFFATLSFFFVRLLTNDEKNREELADAAVKLSRLNEELETKNERLKQLDEQRSKFIGVASHQLRAPLTAIIGYSSMLTEGSFGKLPKKALLASSKIFRSGKNLMSTINDFLDVSTLETGQLHFSFGPVDLGELTKFISDEMRGNVEFAGLSLSLEIPSNEPLMVRGDRDKLRHVITNLIDNAVHYTQKGGIALTIKKTKDKIILTVVDTGIGISKETLSILFEKFARGKEGESHSAEGVGLGLYLAREIIRAHEGTIRAESDGPGKGSRFTIELPVWRG